MHLLTGEVRQLKSAEKDECEKLFGGVHQNLPLVKNGIKLVLHKKV